MDKFEQFGECMVVLSTTLPPGVAFRKNHIGLNKALMGMEMMKDDDDGGSDEQIEAQYALNQSQKWYDDEQLIRKRDEAIRLNAIKRDELEASIGRQNAMGQAQADYALASHNFQFDRQMEAFNKSEALYGRGVDLVQKNKDQQLDYNRTSFNLSKESIENQVFERYQKLAFKTTEALMAHQKGAETGSLKYAETLKGLQQKRTKAVMTQQAERAQGAQQSLITQLQGAKDEGKVRARGVEGRSNEKQIQAALAKSGLKQSMLYDKITRSGFAFDAAIYGMETALRHTMADNNVRVKYSNLDYALKEKQLAATDLSIGKAYALSQKGAEHQWKGANMQARLKAEQAMLTLDSQRMIKPVAGPKPPGWESLAVPYVADPIPLEFGPDPIRGAMLGSSSQGMGTGGMVTAGLGAAAGLLQMGTGIAAASSAASVAAGTGAVALIGPWAPVAVAALAIGSMFIDW